MSEEFVLEQLPKIPDEVTAERLKICGMYVLALDAMVEARETQALAFAHRLGVALAALIATLKLAPEDAQQARPDWNTAHWKTRVSQFGISISVFIDQDGKIPTSSSSFYTSLSEFHLTREFEQRLAEQLGGSCVVNIMHEGTAAANSMDGLDAAILLGTSVGGGLRD